MYYIFIPFACLVAVCLSRIIIPEIIHAAFKKRLFDVPDVRKLHTSAIPRLGGFSFAPVILFTLALTCALVYQYDTEETRLNIVAKLPEMMFFICGLVVLYLIGILDDMVGSRYRIKFTAQIIAAACIPLAGVWINNLYGLFGIYALTPWIGIPLTMFLTVLIINSINLIDGIDGLASGVSCVSLKILGAALIIQQSWMFATLAFITVGMLFPFFYYNVFGESEKHNKIFMGDTGSLILGYIQAFLAIEVLSLTPYTPPYNMLVIAFAALFLPAFDVFRVITVRLYNRKHIFMPDRGHIHHKLLSIGLTPRWVLATLIVVDVIFCWLNIWLCFYDANVTALILADIALWVGLNIIINRMISKRENSAVKSEE